MHNQAERDAGDAQDPENGPPSVVIAQVAGDRPDRDEADDFRAVQHILAARPRGGAVPITDQGDGRRQEKALGKSQGDPKGAEGDQSVGESGHGHDETPKREAVDAYPGPGVAISERPGDR